MKPLELLSLPYFDYFKCVGVAFLTDICHGNAYRNINFTRGMGPRPWNANLGGAKSRNKKGVIFQARVRGILKRVKFGMYSFPFVCSACLRFYAMYLSFKWRLYLRPHNRKTRAPRWMYSYIRSALKLLLMEFRSLMGIIWSIKVWNKVEQKA